MLMLWIILGIVGLVVLAVVIYSVIWVFVNLSKGRKDPEHFEKIKQKSEDQIRKNDEQIRKNDERVQRNLEQAQQCQKIIEKNKISRKAQRSINNLATQNVFSEEEMGTITQLTNRATELLDNNTALLDSDIALTDESIKMIKRQTQIIGTFRDKKRDELQPELEELDIKIQEVEAQIAELNVQTQAQRIEIDATNAELAKWAELGRSRLSK